MNINKGSDEDPRHIQGIQKVQKESRLWFWIMMAFILGLIISVVKNVNAQEAVPAPPSSLPPKLAPTTPTKVIGGLIYECEPYDPASKSYACTVRPIKFTSTEAQ